MTEEFKIYAVYGIDTKDEFVKPEGEDIISEELLAKHEARIPSFNKVESDERFNKLLEQFLEDPLEGEIPFEGMTKDNILMLRDFAKSVSDSDPYKYLITSKQVIHKKRLWSQLQSTLFLSKDKFVKQELEEQQFIDRRVDTKEYTPEEWNEIFSKSFHEANIKFGYYPDPDKAPEAKHKTKI